MSSFQTLLWITVIHTYYFITGYMHGLYGEPNSSVFLHSLVVHSLKLWRVGCSLMCIQHWTTPTCCCGLLRNSTRPKLLTRLWKIFELGNSAQ